MNTVRVRQLTVRKVLGTFVTLFVVSLPAVQASTGEMPITSSSKEALQLFEQGRDRLDNVEIAEAVPLLDQAVQKDPEFAMAYAYRALASGGDLEYRRNVDKAVALAGKVSPGERHMILAIKAQADEDSPAQKAHLERLSALFPNDKRVHLQLGAYTGFVLADHKQALAHFRKATAIDPKFDAAYNMIGYAEMALRNYPAAEQALKQYIALRPDRPNPYDSYAEFLMARGRHDESIAQYRKALAIDPSFKLSLRGIGDNHVFTRSFVEARTAYEELYQKAPAPDDRLLAIRSIATSYVHEGNTAKALEAIERLRGVAEKERLAPAIIGAHHDAAFILSGAGRHKEALKHIEEAAGARESSSLPDSIKQQGRLSDSLVRAMILAKQAQFEAADAELKKVAATIESSKNPPLQRFHHMAAGMVALEQGENKEALAHLSMADPDNPYVMFHKGIAHEKLGHQNEAAKLFKDVAGWNSNSLEYAVVRARAFGKVGKT